MTMTFELDNRPAFKNTLICKFHNTYINPCWFIKIAFYIKFFLQNIQRMYDKNQKNRWNDFYNESELH
jgi:hypothetical protein